MKGCVVLVYAWLEDLFQVIVEYGVLLMEFVGVVIIIVTGFQCVLMMIQHRDEVRLKLAMGIAMALEFKLGGEVLRTTLVRDLSEIAIVGAIIALRCVMTFLIHWEISEEVKRMDLLHHVVGPVEGDKVSAKAK
ncbi:MAG: DUF1622 domain-containing protein [Clostridia bacterium]